MTATFYVGKKQRRDAALTWEEVRDRQKVKLDKIAEANPKPTRPNELSVVFQLGRVTIAQREQEVAKAAEEAYLDLSDLDLADRAAFEATKAVHLTGEEVHVSPTEPEGSAIAEFSASPEEYSAQQPESSPPTPKFISGE